MADRYRKKPVVIEAVQCDGRPDATQEIAEWCGGELTVRDGRSGGVVAAVAIVTLEGTMLAFPGDWVIKGVQGEFYPCKANVFEATYDPAPEPGTETDWRAHAEMLAEALRLTQEYIGNTALPPTDDWAWFAALERHKAAVAGGE